MKTKREETSHTVNTGDCVLNKTNSTPAPVKFAISRKTVKNKENPSCLAKVIFYSQNKKHWKKLVVEFN